jgi:polysaccharide biosynthesis/export protein
VNKLFIVTTIVLMAVGPALAQAPQPAPAQQVPQPAPEQVPLQEPPVGQGPATAPVESFYKLQASDVVFVKYRYTPEYDATVTVRPDGFITLPIVGEVRVAGLTVADARREVVKYASQRLRDPELTLELKDFLKPRFVVGGQVDKPGQFELRGRVTVLEAIAMAGGFKNSAKHSQVVLFRRYDDQRALTRVINAKKLQKANSVAEDPDLRAGDFLFVPQNNLSKIERLVPFTTIGWLFTGIAR